MNAMKYTALCLYLTGCSPRPAIVQPVDVDIPVAVNCTIQTVPRPEWNILKLSQTADEADKLKAALEDLEWSKAYIVELEAELASCS